MTMRRFTAALAVPCLCLLAAPANAQSRIAGPPNILPSNPRALTLDMRDVERPMGDDSFRLREDGPSRTGGSAMIRSWAVDANAEAGLGRFTVPNSARPRTHTERIGSGMEAETRRIAGAGMQIRF